MSTGWGQLPRESPRQFAAFEYYRELGPAERCLRLASERTGHPRRTIERWSRAFSWPTRAQAFDAGLSATAEVLASSDLKRDVAAGLFAQVDMQFQRMMRGEEPDRSPAEVALLLSQATKGWDSLDVGPSAREELDASWDDSRLTHEDRTWLAEIQSLTALPDVEPETDPRVVDTKRRIKEMLTLVDRWLKGDAESPLTQRDACRLYAEVRAQQKRLAKLGTPKRRGTHDYSSLGLPELQRLARIDDIARGRTQPTS